MATIKSYTDLEQSKKLAEILPLESADMGWNVFVDGTTRILPIDDWDLTKDGDGHVKFYHAWSLAALLGVLPFRLIVNKQWYAFSMHKGLDKDGETYMFRYNIFNTDVCLYSTDYYNNPVDACFDMVEKLKELGWL